MTPHVAIGRSEKVALNSLVLLTVLLAPANFPALGKTHEAALQGLVQEQPVFDLTTSQMSFQLSAQHNEFRRSARKPLLHAQDSLGLLKGSTKKFQLNANANGTNLRAQSAKNAVSLQGSIDKNGKPLTGKAVVDPRSPLNTIERFSSPFQLALDKLPDLAPDITFQMDQQLQKAHSQTAGDTARREQLMDANLHAAKPRSDIPDGKTAPTADATLSRRFNSELKKAQDNQKSKTGAGNSPLKLAIAPGIGAPVKAPGIPGGGSGNLPKIKFPGFPETETATDKLKRSENEMDAQLSNVHSAAPKFPNQVTTRIPDNNTAVRLSENRPAPGLDAVLTHVRSLPVAAFPSLPKSNTTGETSDVVPWDDWHNRFAQIARDPILRNVSQLKQPIGSDTVEITVWRNLAVDAKLTKSGTGDFDKAILRAYKSLSGNPGLVFPAHSRREKITFQVDNEHHGAGIPSSVQSQTKTGDREIIQHHI